jgi:hypothetical protein
MPGEQGAAEDAVADVQLVEVREVRTSAMFT